MHTELCKNDLFLYLFVCKNDLFLALPRKSCFIQHLSFVFLLISLLAGVVGSISKSRRQDGLETYQHII